MSRSQTVAEAGGGGGVALVFADMDDTFLARDKSLPRANLAALDLLAAAGTEFVPCTGRSWRDVPSAITTHPACHHVIACNGAVVWEVASASVVRRRTIGAKTVLAIYRSVRSLDVTFDVFMGGKAFAERNRLERLTHGYDLDAGTLSMLRAVRTPTDTPIDELVSAPGAAPVEKVTTYWADLETRNELAARLAEFAQVGVTSSHPRNFELMAAGVSKGEAMAWLAERSRTPLDRTIAFGDSPNDISMLSLAGDGVAVQNAALEVIAVADHVCASCDDAGPGCYLASLLS